MKLIKALSTTIMVALLAFSSCTSTESALKDSSSLVNDGTIAVRYTTVTEGYDWGPAISKVILDFGTYVDPASVSTYDFSVEVNRRFQDVDWSTFQLLDEVSDHFATRNILAAYVSDGSGKAVTRGSHVTLELEVGPTLTEGSPFNYVIPTGFNDYVETTYFISSADQITLSDGVEVSIETTDADDNAGNMSLIADDFNNNQEYVQGDIALLYADFMPQSAKTGKTPLIIWLHGAGEGGQNTYINILGNKVVNLATDDIQQYFGSTGAAVLAPQSPTMWMDVDGSKTYNNSVEGNTGTSYYTEALMGLIESYVAEHPQIDTDRIYIGGCSNGGFMTINMLLSYPGYFAAAYPSATPYMLNWITDEKIQSLADVPIWFTHAKTDGTVAIYQGETQPDFSYQLSTDENGELIPLDQHSNALYSRLIAAGANNVHYSLFDAVVDTSGNYFQADGVTPYEYMGHWSWIYSLNNECFDEIHGAEVSQFEWLAAQSK